MIAGLDQALEGAGQPGLAELRGFLAELLGGRQAQGRLVEQRTLPPRALRLCRPRFEINGQIRTVVVQRLRPEALKYSSS